MESNETVHQAEEVKHEEENVITEHRASNKEHKYKSVNPGIDNATFDWDSILKDQIIYSRMKKEI